jgi:histidinol phosphatase-like PHP family hydrolase
MHDEFAAAAIQHGTMVEINLEANLLNPHYPERFKRQYMEYIARLKSRGVTLTVGSDCHDPHYSADFETADRMLAGVGIRDEDLWRPAPRAIHRGTSESAVTVSATDRG